MLRPFALLLATCAFAQSDLEQIATDAYIYAYPLVIMDVTREVSVARAPLNHFLHAQAFPDYSFRAVVRPNADTLYSAAWLDLTAEPVIMDVPDTKGRYYVMQIMDAWTNTFAAPGSRTTGNAQGHFAITGPGWRGKLPAGVRQYKSPSNMVWMIGRIQTNTPSDYAFVHSLQRGLRLYPLSAWGQPPPANPPPAPPPPRMGRTPLQELGEMKADAFFERFAKLLSANPPLAADGPMVAKLKQLGIVPGRPFAFANLDPAVRQALERGREQGQRQLLANPDTLGSRNNGWTTLLKIGAYGTDYRMRAAIARMGLGANLPEDAVYPLAMTDAAGQPFDGKKRYLLHFEKHQLPPVKAFWSLTAYDSRGFFTENAIGRYAIGDRDKLRFNPDGSLDIYIQHDRPAPSNEPNWLPVAAEGFNLALRLYWPDSAILNGTWNVPAIRSVD